MPYLVAASIYFRLEQLAVSYPSLCTVGKFVFKTTENVTGKYLRIAKFPVVDGSSVLITAGIHAREWAPPDAVLSLAEVLLNAYQNNTPIIEAGYTLPAAAVQSIVNNLEIYIAPVINPDGRNFSQTSVANMSWRKNRREIRMVNPASGQLYRDAGGRLPVGIDINRNFDIEWDYEQFFKANAGVSASKDPRDPEVFIGTGVASERETQNVARLLIEKRITHFIDVHANAQKVLYPWGIESNQTTDPTKSFTNQRQPPAGWFRARDGLRANAYEEFIPAAQLAELKRVAQIMSDAVAKATGAAYPPEQSATGLYVTTGASDDFAYSRDIQHMYAFTLELGGGTFWPDYVSEFPTLEHECHAALLGALDDIAKHPRPSPGGAAGPGGPGSAGTTVPSSGGGRGAGGGGGGFPPILHLPDDRSARLTKKQKCRVEANGHCTCFYVKNQDGLREQVVFVASHPGVAGTPLSDDRVFAYETITNHGPRAVRVFWDGSPPKYETSGQSALLLPGNSITVAVSRAVKIVYSPDPAHGLTGDYAQGTDVISWCCPKPWATLKS